MKQSKLTKAQMRVAVAKDALAQLNAGRYKATKDTYIDHTFISAIKESCPNESNSAQSYLKNTTHTCDVCVKGGLFISAIRKFNKVKVSQLDKDDEFKVARDIFGRENFNRMECAFELWMEKVKDKDGNLQASPIAMNFGMKYATARGRFEAILLNVIKNKGIFKPALES